MNALPPASRRQLPAAGDPHVLVVTPHVVAGDPDVPRRRLHHDDFLARRRRARVHDHFLHGDDGRVFPKARDKSMATVAEGVEKNAALSAESVARLAESLSKLVSFIIDETQKKQSLQ